MKVCYVSAFPPNKGNLAEYGNYFVKEICKSKDVDEVVVLGNICPDSKKVEKSGKIKIIRCWKNNSASIPFNILINVFKENPDIVHFNLHMMSWGDGKVSNFFGASTPMIVKKFLRKKVIITLHNIFEAANLKELKINDNKITQLGAYLATTMLLKADKVTTTLDEYRKILSRKYKKKNIVKIFHGTLGKKVNKIKVGGKKILTFGFWRSNKNLPFLIEVFNELRKEDKKISLIVAGKSHPNFKGYYKNLKKTYGKMEKVIFTGYVPEEKLAETFIDSTVVVLPYTAATGTSGIIHLATSYGKPLVVSDLPEFRKTMEEEGFELIFFTKNDKESAKKVIKKIINQKSLQKRIAEKNLKLAEKFSFFNISKEYIKIYNELLEIDD